MAYFMNKFTNIIEFLWCWSLCRFGCYLDRYNSILLEMVNAESKSHRSLWDSLQPHHPLNGKYRHVSQISQSGAKPVINVGNKTPKSLYKSLKHYPAEITYLICELLIMSNLEWEVGGEEEVHKWPLRIHCYPQSSKVCSLWSKILNDPVLTTF